MNIDPFITQMANNAQTIRALTEGVSNEQARWKPNPKTWSLLEVICHLVDEEREDFRTRVDTILHKPGEDPPGIDPQAWVSERQYNQRNPAEMIAAFLAEREQSLAWLRGLESPDWDAFWEAPWGPMRAGDIFVSWVAHDLLHTRQLVELHYLYTNTQVQPYQTVYAGDW
jgi:hypothetical protein